MPNEVTYGGGSGSLLPVRVSTKVPDLLKRQSDLEKIFKAHMRQAHDEAVKTTVRAVKDAIKVKNARATGNLLRSITAKVLGSATKGFSAQVGFSGSAAEYAFNVNYGRRRGTAPPIWAIARWLTVKKGLVLKRRLKESEDFDLSLAIRVAHNIAIKGTPPKLFMELAASNLKGVQQKIYREALAEFKANH